MAMTATNWSELAQREVIVGLGQWSAQDKRDLNKMVRIGAVAKWRGKWFPIAGAHFGLGPDKTCYGPVEVANELAEWRDLDRRPI